MGARYVPDHKGIGRLARSTQMSRICVEAAGRGKGAARGVASRFSRSGRYATSFDVRPELVTVLTKRGKSRRAGAVLVNTAPYAAVLEVQYRKQVLQTVIDAIEKG